MGRHRWRAIALAALVGAAAPPALASHEAPVVLASACSERSWTGGSTEWCAGAFVYRDHVYDDTGADTASDSPHGAQSNPATGDVDHRQHGQSLNSADLLVLRLQAVDGGLLARFELNTLLPGDATIAAVAVDIDDDVTTGGGSWGRVTVSSVGWDTVGVLDGADADTNVIEGVVPVDLPATGTLRIQAVVALGDGTPMNVAFRPDETGDWWEAQQSAALATGDVSAFGARVAAEDLRAGLDQPAPLGPGFHARVHYSELAIGEGVDPAGVMGQTTSRWTHLGHHQPYAVYVPDPIPRDLQLVLHGAFGGHAALVSGPGAQAVLGDGQRRILVSPFGRGDTGGYVDWSAHDVLAALHDAERVYGTDPDTVVVSGYSMGGGGTLALASWFPDRFAAAIAWVPFTGDCLQGTPLAQGHQRLDLLDLIDGNSAADRSGCPLGVRGNTFDLFENLRHVPTAMLFGAADELVWANHPLAVALRMRELGYEHRLWVHTAEHLTFGVLDDWRNEAAWSAGRRRPPSAARVTYRTNAYEFVPELGLLPDGAYWVDEIRPRDASPTPEGDAAVDLTSHACPAGGDRQVEVRTDLGVEPLPYIGQYGTVVGETAPDGSVRITGTLTNVASFLVDVDAACIGDRGVLVDLATDGPTEVRFSDGRPPLVVVP